MEEKTKEMVLKYTFAKLAEAQKLVKSQTELDGKPFKKRKTYSRIKKHLDYFMAGKTDNRFVVLPGLRGVGKTTMLFQIYEHLKHIEKIDQDRILYFSTDELKSYLGVRIIDIINTFIEEIHQTSLVNLDEKLFILIDESHFDHEWSQAGKIIFDKTKNIFMIFTGSSALNLELSIDAARRAVKESVFPLNFSEYLILKYDIHAPKEISENIRKIIFKPTKKILEKLSKNEIELKKKTLKLKKTLENEWIDFLSHRGFPFGLYMNQIEVHERVFNMVNRVIEKDVFSVQSFSTETRNTIARVLTFLALQKPGGTSDTKLAERIKTSPALIRNILEVLEKTHLVFSIKPYGSAGKIVRKPWKYYFLTPTINAAMRFKLGTYNKRDKETLGILAETLVASYFFRMKETKGFPIGIFYDADKEGVDFLLQDANNNIIPVEVSIGTKDKRQIKKAIKKYNVKYGIVVCKIERIKKEENIIFIPITTFSFV